MKKPPPPPPKKKTAPKRRTSIHDKGEEYWGLSSVVRVKVDFMLDYEKNPELPTRLLNGGTNSFVTAGLRAVYPSEELREKHGDIHLAGGAHYTLSRVTVGELTRWKKKRINELQGHLYADYPPKFIAALVKETQQFGTPEGHDSHLQYAHEAKYPMLTLLDKNSDKRKDLVEFLQWCRQEKRFGLGDLESMGRDGGIQTVAEGDNAMDQLVLEHLGIDPAALEKERRALIEEQRAKADTKTA